MLANSAIARQMTIGSSWTRIRIVVHLSMNGINSISGSPHLAIGVCNGTSNIYPGTSHFAGYYTNTTGFTVATTSFTGVTNGASGRVRLLKKEGTTETLGTDSNNTVGAGQFLGGSTLSNNNSLIILEIEKTSGTTWTFRIGGSNSITTGTVSDDLALQVAEQAWNSFTLTSPAHVYWRPQETQTIDEGANGVMNAVNISWDRTDPVIDILNVFVCRLLP